MTQAKTEIGRRRQRQRKMSQAEIERQGLLGNIAYLRRPTADHPNGLSDAEIRATLPALRCATVATLRNLGLAPPEDVAPTENGPSAKDKVIGALDKLIIQRQWVPNAKLAKMAGVSESRLAVLIKEYPEVDRGVQKMRDFVSPETWQPYHRATADQKAKAYKLANKFVDQALAEGRTITRAQIAIAAGQYHGRTTPWCTRERKKPRMKELLAKAAPVLAHRTTTTPNYREGKINAAYNAIDSAAADGRTYTMAALAISVGCQPVWLSSAKNKGKTWALDILAYAEKKGVLVSGTPQPRAESVKKAYGHIKITSAKGETTTLYGISLAAGESSSWLWLAVNRGAPWALEIVSKAKELKVLRKGRVKK